jgi:hypothetical protein
MDLHFFLFWQSGILVKGWSRVAPSMSSKPDKGLIRGMFKLIIVVLADCDLKSGGFCKFVQLVAFFCD